MRAVVRQLFLVAMVVSASIAHADRVVPGDQVTQHVRVRESPSADSEEIGRLAVGDSAEYVRSVPRWYEIRLSDGRLGFVSKSKTRIVQGDTSARQFNELRIHYLNIGAGTCTLVECPGSHAPPLVIDCGSLEATADDMSQEDTKTYIRGILASHGTRPNLVLSHADRDHYGWIAHVLDGVRLQHIWQGGDAGDYSADGFPTWIAGQRAAGATIHSNLPENWHNAAKTLGADLDCGLASVYVLTVNAGESKNAQSLVLMIEYEDFVAIFTGDAEGDTERAARDNFGADVRATVLTTSHHGARTHSSNSEPWAAATAPRVVISSSGRKFGHPQCEATTRFEGTLASAPQHDFQCGNGAAYQPVRKTSRAEYVTEVNGRLVVTSTGRSPCLLTCTASTGCEAQISH